MCERCTAGYLKAELRSSCVALFLIITAHSIKTSVYIRSALTYQKFCTRTRPKNYTYNTMLRWLGQHLWSGPFAAAGTWRSFSHFKFTFG